jgi:hypothetical protein
MSLELYFANLSSTTGAIKFVLESDNASLHGPTRSKKMLKRSVNVGPPNFPLRQKSHDKLDDFSAHKRTLRKPQDADTLEDFYNAVAPGIRPRKMQSPRSPNLKLLYPGRMAKVLRLTDFKGINKQENQEPQKSLCDFLDEAQNVVASPRSSIWIADVELLQCRISKSPSPDFAGLGRYSESSAK